MNWETLSTVAPIRGVAMDDESFLDEYAFLLMILVWVFYFTLVGVGVMALGDESRWTD